MKMKFFMASTRLQATEAWLGKGCWVPLEMLGSLGIYETGPLEI